LGYLKVLFYPISFELSGNQKMKLKTKTAARVLLLLFSLSVSFGQITDAEKKLRAVNADTIMGWKKGGVLGINLAQTSLTNWAAGGQNSFAINRIFSAFANYKQGKSAMG
jgi:hypothetical protein